LRLYIGVTDDQWFRFLRNQPGIDEVNFWQPGGSAAFRALEPGELFLFKLHSPQNFIVGGGIFLEHVRFPYRFVWEAFKEKNGASTLDEMKRRIEKLRRAPVGPNDQIGCILLGQPFFFDEFQWIPAPADFALNIVQGKTYGLESATGRELWEKVSQRLRATKVWELGEGAREEVERPVYGDPVLVRPRLGQGSFRILTADNYERRCAVTGEKALPVLDAAHIQPVARGGQHRLANGLLLRTDVHRLFDDGYVTVTPDGRFQVSSRLKSDFDNGEPYMPHHGQKIWMPGDPVSQPDRRLLEWHADVVFLR